MIRADQSSSSLSPPHVLVSLLPLPDESTALLSEREFVLQVAKPRGRALHILDQRRRRGRAAQVTFTPRFPVPFTTQPPKKHGYITRTIYGQVLRIGVSLPWNCAQHIPKSLLAGRKSPGLSVSSDPSRFTTLLTIPHPDSKTRLLGFVARRTSSRSSSPVLRSFFSRLARVRFREGARHGMRTCLASTWLHDNDHMGEELG